MKMMMSVLDKVASIYNQPFFVPAVGVATRNLQDEVRKGGEDNVLAGHPGDFALYHLGTFHEERGFLEANEKPIFVCEVASLVEASDVSK